MEERFLGLTNDPAGQLRIRSSLHLDEFVLYLLWSLQRCIRIILYRGLLKGQRDGLTHAK
jgi:hypothetical protein